MRRTPAWHQALLAVASMLTGSSLLLSVAVIWVAHIGFDRMFGFGLKYKLGFGYTHLGRIGRASAADSTT